MKRFLLPAAALLSLVLLPGTVRAQSSARPVSPAAKVEIDNDWVRVLRLKQGPHESLPVIGPDVLVYLTDAHQKFTAPNGSVEDVTRKAGDVAYVSAAKSVEQNASDAPLEVALIELKPGPANAPKPAPITLDPVKLDPQHHIVLLENDRVRAFRTILEPHLKSPLHQHPHYVVVYVTGLHTTQTLPDGRVVDNPRAPGEIAWRDALSHVTENIGDKMAMEIQVELK